MNTQCYNILLKLLSEPYSNQRKLAKSCGCSLGMVNQTLKKLIENNYIDSHYHITEKTKRELEIKRPKNAIILAAGFGMRMIPINLSRPKGLLEVYGEPLIERLIRQLHESGIYDITVIVGFMKEQHEYLIDKYNVNFIVNPDYYTKNNLHSLALALGCLSNTYIIPCDLWFQENPFHTYELYSWYMVSEEVSAESSVIVNRKMELTTVTDSQPGNKMIGIAYILGSEAATVRNRVLELCKYTHYNHAFWEEALLQKGKMIIAPKVVPSGSAIEINTYEQLRELDNSSNALHSDAIEIISEVFNVNPDAITNITVLKKGMTNRSFTFECNGKKYIMRIPGEGTSKLINRKNEALTYHTVKSTAYCDEVLYINPENGYKITRFWDNARTCDPFNEDDLQKSMKLLRAFHRQKLSVPHEFNIFEQILFYEELWDGKSSSYPDYQQTKANVFSLKPYIAAHCSEKTLTHLDAVPDNFLFIQNGSCGENVHLIDWEYAGMQDPHMDIAMFCVYAMYDRQQIDNLIRIYFKAECPENIHTKIYCYIACCGLLWSNWCEYKQMLGVEFGKYSLWQYRYAKEYYRLVQDKISKETEKQCIMLNEQSS